nr:ribonucleoside-diphosphate reductase large subunit-like isoform X4 [Ipomoea trifida]
MLLLFSRRTSYRDLFYALWVPVLFMEEYRIETGTSYMLYKILSTKKSNQQNLGTIKSLRLLSIQAQRKLRSAIWLQLLCHDLSGKRSIGIGVQGLADTFTLLGMAFYSPEAQDLNTEIFETIYYHGLKASSDLAAKEGPL